MASSDDEDLYFDAQEGSDTDQYFPDQFRGTSNTCPGNKSDSISPSHHPISSSPAHMDGRKRTLTSLFGDAKVKSIEDGDLFAAAEQKPTQRDIEVNMRTFSALSSHLSLNAGSVDGADDEIPRDTVRLSETAAHASREDIVANAAINLSGTSDTSQSQSNSGSSCSRKRNAWGNLKHFFKRQSSSTDPPEEHVPGSVNVYGPHKRQDDIFMEYGGLRLLQSFSAHTGACWSMKLSPDGRYLATAGQDTYMSIWLIAPVADSTSSLSRDVNDLKTEKLFFADHIDEESDEGTTSDTGGVHRKKEADHPVDGPPDRPRFRMDKIIDDSTPIQIYRDHLSDIIDISWSTNNFILSASLDKTVRLWHVSRPDCLMVCRHPDVVSGVAFHPLSDRFFLTGSLDKKLRVWDMDGGTPTVSAWAQTPEMISSVCYYTNGSMAVAGLTNGIVFLYDANNKMKYYTQILCRNRAGKFRHGCKISGVQHVPNAVIPQINALPVNGAVTAARAEPAQLLVSSNDSRIRLFRLNDFSLRTKFKGHSTSTKLPIRAAVSECGHYILSGSEQGRVFVWKRFSGRREVRSTDAYTNGGDGAAYITTLRSGLNILRNSDYESFENDVKFDANRNVELKSSEESNPVLCTCFGTTGLVKLVLSKDKIHQLYKEKYGYRISGSVIHPEAVSTSKVEDTLNDMTEWIPSKATLRNFVAELAHNVIITADYSGEIRVFVKGF